MADHGIARDQLRAFIERIERLEEEKKSVSDDIKEVYADRVMSIVETYAPGTTSKVLGRAVYSPDDLERENPNLIGGDNLAGSHHLDQNFLFRPVAGYSRYRTPVKNLYMCGAFTWPGAGTGAGSGYMLAQMLGR